MQSSVEKADNAALLLLNVDSPPGLLATLSNTTELLDDLQEQEEECIKDILDLCRELALSEQPFQHPAEAVDFIREQRVLENLTCFDLDPDHITKLLRHQILMTDRYPGCEEDVIKQMLELSSVDGVAMPTHSSLADPVSASRLSINTATGSSTEHLNETLWSELCNKLKRYLVEKLRRTDIPDTSYQRAKRLSYLQYMCALFPANEAWGVYRSIRMIQVDRLLAEWEENDENQPQTFSVFALKIAAFAEKLQPIIMEDFHLLNSGVFGSSVSCMESLHSLYYERLLDEISALIDNLQNELPEQKPSNSSLNSQANRQTKGKDARNDHGNILGHLKTNLRKQKSASMDSLIMSGEVTFTDLQGVPYSMLKPLRDLVEALLSMEGHREAIEDLLSWDITGNNPPKRSLKSALKASRMTDPQSAPQHDVDKELTEIESLHSGSATPFKVVEKVSETLPRWNWRVSFRKVMPDTAKCLEVHIQREGGLPLGEEWQRFEAGHALQLIPVEKDLVGGRLDYPKRITKGMYTAWSTLDESLPLALAGTEGCFVMLRSAFVDTTITIFKTHLSRVQTYFSENRDWVPSLSLYGVLSSLAYSRNHIMQYQSKLGLEEASGRPLNLLYRRYCELVDSLSKRIIEYHTHVIITSVFFDAESHNVADTKQFYEGERSAFTIQSWLLLMKRLKHDTWSCCPPQLSQAILLAVLQDSLNHLTNRYINATPSYARYQQMRSDIGVILACVCEILWSVCSNISQLFSPSPLSNKQHHSIHNSCCHLLATLAITTSPLQVLVDSAYMSGQEAGCHGDGVSDKPGHPAHWLHWLHPAVFPSEQITCGELQTTTAIQLHLELMINQPCITYSMLLQVLLMKDYTLSILLATQLALGSPADAPPKDDDHPSASTESLTGSLHPGVNPEGCNVCQKMLTSLLRVLSQCDRFPDALAKVILPLVERTDSWGIFENVGGSSSQKKMPAWMDVILSLTETYIDRCVEPCVEVILERLSDKHHLEPLHTKMSQLPCRCSLQSYSPTSRKDAAAEVLYCLLGQLAQNITLLPQPLIMLLRTLQRQSDQHHATPADSIALQVISMALKRLLLSPERVSQMMGVYKLSSDVTDMLVMVSECVHAILNGQSNTGKSVVVPRVARLFMKANHTWLQQQLHTMTTYIHNDENDHKTSVSLDGGMTDLLLDTQLSAVTTLTGNEDLDQLLQFVTQNVGWIGKLLDFQPGLSLHPRSEKMSLTASQADYQSFNPLTAYRLPTQNNLIKQLGQETCDFNWQQLLACDLGISEVGLRSLVSNRFELHDLTHLDKEEKRLVQIISNRFHLDISL